MRAVTAWAATYRAMSFIYAFPVMINRPPCIAVPCCEDASSTGTTARRDRHSAHLTFLQALFRWECAKYVIILDCVDIILGDGKKDGSAAQRWEEMERCHGRLTQWWKGRSKDLDADLMPTRENLLCAMMYHVHIINLFRPALQREGASTAVQPKAYYDHARSVTVAAVQEIHRLLALQQVRHGWMDSITLVLHPITVASFGTLEEISRANMDARSRSLDGSELYQGLRTCLRALASLTSYSYYAQPLFRLLTSKCQRLGIRLPSEVRATLEGYMTDEWTRNAAALVSSQYIPDTHTAARDAESARMDAVISSWEALSLDGTGKAKGGGQWA